MKMKKFYGLGYTQKGMLQHVYTDADTRIEAENDVWAKCEQLGLEFDQVRPFSQSRRGGDTTTKNFRERKKLRAAGKRTDLF
jgi:hypothetical protein